MNGARLHLALNHLPVVGVLFGSVLLAAGMALRSESLRRGALALLALAGLSAAPAFLSGEPAEEIVGGIPGLPETLIEQHEEAASAALTGALVVGAVAAVGLFLIRRRGAAPKGLYAFALVLALAAAALLGRTAHLGGLIRHPEIGGGAAVPGGGQ